MVTGTGSNGGTGTRGWHRRWLHDHLLGLLHGTIALPPLVDGRQDRWVNFRVSLLSSWWCNSNGHFLNDILHVLSRSDSIIIHIGS